MNVFPMIPEMQMKVEQREYSPSPKRGGDIVPRCQKRVFNQG